LIKFLYQHTYISDKSSLT